MINEKYSNSSICPSNVDYQQQQNFNHLCSFLTSSFFLSIHPHINKKDCSFSIITRLYLSIPHANPSFSWKKRTKKKYIYCVYAHAYSWRGSNPRCLFFYIENLLILFFLSTIVVHCTYTLGS